MEFLQMELEQKPDKKIEDKDYYLISDATITNIDENQQKENKKKL